MRVHKPLPTHNRPPPQLTNNGAVAKKKKKAISSPDEGVDVLRLDVVEGLDGVLDLALVRLDVHDEDEGVVVLDLLHRALCREGELDDAVLVHLR